VTYRLANAPRFGEHGPGKVFVALFNLSERSGRPWHIERFGAGPGCVDSLCGQSRHLSECDFADGFCEPNGDALLVLALWAAATETRTGQAVCGQCALIWLGGYWRECVCEE
jgi:hypothetical protein